MDLTTYICPFLIQLFEFCFQGKGKMRTYWLIGEKQDSQGQDSGARLSWAAETSSNMAASGISSQPGKVPAISLSDPAEDGGQGQTAVSGHLSQLPSSPIPVNIQVGSLTHFLSGFFSQNKILNSGDRPTCTRQQQQKRMSFVYPIVGLFINLSFKRIRIFTSPAAACSKRVKHFSFLLGWSKRETRQFTNFEKPCNIKSPP